MTSIRDIVDKFGHQGVVGAANSDKDMADYEQLHRQCRTLENLFDSKLTSYSHLVAAISQPSHDVEANGSAGRWRDMEAELDGLLEKVRVSLILPLDLCAYRIVARGDE